jgi:hypothetical protein
VEQDQEGKIYKTARQYEGMISVEIDFNGLRSLKEYDWLAFPHNIQRFPNEAVAGAGSVDESNI